MNEAPKPVSTLFTWLFWIVGGCFLLNAVIDFIVGAMFAWGGTPVMLHDWAKDKDVGKLLFTALFCYGPLVGGLISYWIGMALVRLPGKRKRAAEARQNPLGAPSAASSGAPSPVPSLNPPPLPTHHQPAHARNKRWNSCNILHLAPDAKRLWQFDAKGGGFALAREHRTPHAESIPSKGVTKGFGAYFQPKLNIAWLPLDNVFLRVIELPAASADETFSMVELQLEKVSPIPLTQAVWALHPLGTHQGVAKADGTAESLQTVVVIIATRSAVEEYLGRLEREGYLADRLEVPMLDQLEAISPKSDGTWLFPLTLDGQNAALTAWWYGGALRSLSLITVPAAGDRVTELRNQISLLAMAGEMEGWLNATPNWHLVADPVNAAEWEGLLQAALNEPVRVSPPPAHAELAGRTARRAAAAPAAVGLLPAEFSSRYRQQFVDRLWLRGLGWVGIAYAIYLVIYFSAATFRGYQTSNLESAVNAISNDYTNTVQLKARLDVLQTREQLKFAALDCWKVVSEETPAGVQLQHMTFSEGHRLQLNGTTTPDMINSLFDFDAAIRKYKTDKDQQFFDPQLGEHVNPRLQGPSTEVWSCSMELMRIEQEQP